MFEVYEFDRKHFDVAVATGNFPIESVGSDEHVDYLYRYLNNREIAARTIVKEFDYIDGDFLQDFAAYYVSCFSEYDRHCNRLHFFSESFSRVHFEAILTGRTKSKHLKRLRKSYLGFIVIRPLPDAIIGRTQLKTYASDNGRRHYEALVDYDVNLFGLKLRVRSLAFQEQDKVLSACATVALWSCFQKTSRLFGTAAPRPPKITLDATSAVFDRRSFPSSGLYIEQICSAIQRNGLDPEVFGLAAMTDAPVASLLYGYLRAGLPVLVVVKVDDLGSHALTVAGYSLRTKQVHDDETGAASPIPLIGRRIDEFYAHDDQQGPFSRLKFYPPSMPGEPPSFEGSWRRDDATACTLTPTQVIVPVYPKIRLHYLQALDWVNEMNAAVQGVARATGNELLEWDVYLTTTNDYKKRLRNDGLLNTRRLQHLLTTPQPRFFWCCVAQTDREKAIVELLIDATGFANSFPVMAINFYDETFATILVVVTPSSADVIQKSLRKLIHEEYRDRHGPVSKAATTD